MRLDGELSVSVLTWQYMMWLCLKDIPTNYKMHFLFSVLVFTAAVTHSIISKITDSKSFH